MKGLGRRDRFRKEREKVWGEEGKGLERGGLRFGKER